MGEMAAQQIRERDLAAQRRIAAAKERLAAQMEAKVAKVEMAGMSTSDFASHGDAWGSGPLVTDFAKSLQADMQIREHNKRNAHASLETEADGVAADFANDHAVQRGRQREKTEADAKQAQQARILTGVLAGVATAGLGAAQVLREISELQTSGAKHVGGLQKSLGSSLQSLGATGDQQSDIITQATHGGFGSFASPDEVAELYAAADAAKGMMPASKTGFSQVQSVIAEVTSGRRSVAWGKKVLASGQGFPAAVAGLAKVGTTDDQAPEARAAEIAEARRENDKAESEWRSQRRGNAIAQFQQERENQARDSTMGAASQFLSKITGLTYVYDWASGNRSDRYDKQEQLMLENIRHARQVANNTRPPPPSTTGGR